MVQRNRAMGRWLWVDFWITHLGVACFYVADPAAIFWGSAAASIFQWASNICMFLSGLIFLKLADYEKAFALPGYFVLVNEITRMALRGFGLDLYFTELQVLFTLADLFISYYSYQAYQMALLYADPIFARKWPVLWKCFIVAFVGNIIFAWPVNFLVIGLGLLSRLVLFVCAVMETVYRFKMARLLKHC